LETVAMTTPKHPIVGIPHLRRSQFPKSPPRPAARTEPEIVVDVDLSEMLNEGDRETPLLPRKLPPPLPPPRRK